MRLENKVALITGGAEGIGLAITKRFAEEGASIYIFDLKPPACQLPPTIHFVECDVSSEADIQQALGAIPAQRPIDILVNNAGINPTPGNISQTPPGEWQRIIHNNLDSTYLMSRTVIPRMPNGSAIINIASILALIGARNCAAYAASKGGIVSLSRAMAKDFAPAIRVNCICPGAVQTGMFEEYLARCEDPNAERERIIQAVPLGRLGNPRDVANTALFLASDEAAWITGTNLVVDGGDSI